MKQAVLTGMRTIEIRDVPVPKMKRRDDVLLNIAAVGICGSDVHYYHHGRIGDQIVHYPAVIGHECSAIVAEVGSHVTELKPGDHVVVDPLICCGECSQCKIGRFHTCIHPRFLGCPGQIDGCLSEYIVMPETCCFPISAHLDLALAVFIEPCSIAMYACRLAGNLNHKTIGILGVGPIGLSVLMAAKTQNVTFLAISDKLEYRLQYAKKLGADWIGNPDQSDIVKQISDRCPDQLDHVFECCGDQDALDQAVDLLKPGGTLLIIGIPEGNTIAFDVNKIRRKEICIQNVRRQNRCVQPAIHFLESNMEKLSTIVTHTFRIEETAAAFEMVSAYEDEVIKAVINMM